MQLEIGECFESVNDALVSAVKALGGYKPIGAKLRPELPPDQAGNWLRDCLNAGKREKLSPEQFVLILRMARESSYHAAMDFVAGDAGYKASAIDPEAQQSELQRQFIAAVTAVQHLGARIEANGSRLYSPLRSAA